MPIWDVFSARRAPDSSDAPRDGRAATATGMAVLPSTRQQAAAGDDVVAYIDKNDDYTSIECGGKRQQQEDQKTAHHVQHAAAAEPYRTDLTRDEAPSFATYPFVLRGYRSGGTYARCLQALFEWHAETLNSWTMIWGALAAVALLCLALRALAAAEQDGAHGEGGWWPGAPDCVPFWLLSASTVLHAPFSVGFHLLRGMRKDVYNLWRRLDQVFIFQVGALALPVSLSVCLYLSVLAAAGNPAVCV
jgi:hypothetical protein